MAQPYYPYKLIVCLNDLWDTTVNVSKTLTNPFRVTPLTLSSHHVFLTGSWMWFFGKPLLNLIIIWRFWRNQERLEKRNSSIFEPTRLLDLLYITVYPWASRLFFYPKVILPGLIDKISYIISPKILMMLFIISSSNLHTYAYVFTQMYMHGAFALSLSLSLFKSSIYPV